MTDLRRSTHTSHAIGRRSVTATALHELDSETVLRSYFCNWHALLLSKRAPPLPCLTVLLVGIPLLTDGLGTGSLPVPAGTGSPPVPAKPEDWLRRHCDGRHGRVSECTDVGWQCMSSFLHVHVHAHAHVLVRCPFISPCVWYACYLCPGCACVPLAMGKVHLLRPSIGLLSTHVAIVAACDAFKLTVTPQPAGPALSRMFKAMWFWPASDTFARGVWSFLALRRAILPINTVNEATSLPPVTTACMARSYRGNMRTTFRPMGRTMVRSNGNLEM